MAKTVMKTRNSQAIEDEGVSEPEFHRYFYRVLPFRVNDFPE